jgi:hypothetical protein
MRYSHTSHAGEQIALATMSAVFAVMITALLVTGWLIVQALNLLTTAFAHHPKHPALWTALLSSLGLWSATGIIFASGVATTAGGQMLVGVVGGLAILATAALLLIARVLNIMRSDLLLLDQGKTTLVDKVLRQPWWQKADE